jgi:hypothetical protein
MAGDGASEGLWGCSIVGAVAVVHPWGAGGGASSLEERRWRLTTRGALAAALLAARQRDYGGGAVGEVVVGCSDVVCGDGRGGGYLSRGEQRLVSQSICNSSTVNSTSQ